MASKRKGRWALAGSIIAILGTLPLGVADIIFVAIAKDEFESSNCKCVVMLVRIHPLPVIVFLNSILMTRYYTSLILDKRDQKADILMFVRC